MIKKLFNSILKNFGKQYDVDPQIPSKLFLRVMRVRFFMLLRGLTYLRKKVFLGSNCKVLNKSNVMFGKNVTLENDVFIDGFCAEKIIIGDFSKIGAYSWVTCTSHLSKYGKGLKIGSNSAVGKFSEFGASGGIEIGNNVIMGSYISFHSENHNYSDCSKLIREQGVTSLGIKLGNNIWVGAKATFLDGCEVGDNCVVAAGAIVKGKFPKNVIIGGVPARILKNIE